MCSGNAEEGVLRHGAIQSVFHGGWTARDRCTYIPVSTLPRMPSPLFFTNLNPILALPQPCPPSTHTVFLEAEMSALHYTRHFPKLHVTFHCVTPPTGQQPTPH